MSVTAAEIILFASASMPQDDVSPSGGAIDLTTQIVPTSASLFNALGGSFLDYVSSAAGDTTQSVTVTGRSAAGSIVTETKALNGTTLVNGAVAFQSIEKIVLSAGVAGTLTVSKHTGGATVGTLSGAGLTLRRLFYAAHADAASGGAEVFYEKFFCKNTDATNSLLSATLTETSDPSAVLDYAVALAVNDSVSVANRKTAPPTIAFSSAAQTIPGTDLAAGAAIGIWARLTLAAGQAAAEYAWGIQMAGQTT